MCLCCAPVAHTGTPRETDTERQREDTRTHNTRDLENMSSLAAESNGESHVFAHREQRNLLSSCTERRARRSLKCVHAEGLRSGNWGYTVRSRAELQLSLLLVALLQQLVQRYFRCTDESQSLWSQGALEMHVSH